MILRDRIKSFAAVSLMGALAAMLMAGPVLAVGERMNGANIMPGTVAAAALGTGAVTTTGILDATVAYADVNATGTLAGNPANGASSVWFGTTGLIFEGSTSDTIEGLLVAADVSASDKTWTLPNTTGTLLTTGDSGTVTSTIVADGTVAYADVNATQTVAADPANGANSVWFGTTGFIAEGSTSDGIETLLTFADPAASDKTVTVPATTGTLVTTGDSGTVTSAMLLDATVAAGDLATSAITSANVAGLANTASTLRDRVPGVLTYSMVAADFGANDDIILTVPTGHDILITDITYVGTVAEGGAATATFRTAANGGGTAISSALNLNDTAGNIQRTTVASVAGGALAAGASLYVHCSTNPGTAAGLFVITYVHTN